ncbi:MAG: hypothetical protein K6T31_06245 [Alicyclobacillus sp.]|nr:hypothetical protein [Alicyclobacillus sp.]
MWKEMYRRAIALLHHPVVIEHVNGSWHHGVLIRVSKKGLYLLPFDAVPVTTAAANSEKTDVQLLSPAPQRVDAVPVLYAPVFFPFAVIASFAAGSLLGAAASRPPVPYYPPYGYPYGGYPW